MHMLALFAWMRQRPAHGPELPQVVSLLLRALPARPAPRPQPLERPRPAPAGARTPAKPQQPAPSETPSPAAPAAAPDTALPATAPSLDDARAPVTVQDAIRDQKAADGGFAAALPRRQAGRIDRVLRNGRSGVPDEPDTPIGRLRRGLEAAHVDRSKAVYEDSYTSPDGTIIYRKRIGKATICRRSGNVSPLGMRRMAMAGEAADDVPCPRGVDWKAD